MIGNGLSQLVPILLVVWLSNERILEGLLHFQSCANEGHVGILFKLGLPARYGRVEVDVAEFMTCEPGIGIGIGHSS